MVANIHDFPFIKSRIGISIRCFKSQNSHTRRVILKIKKSSQNFNLIYEIFDQMKDFEAINYLDLMFFKFIGGIGWISFPQIFSKIPLPNTWMVKTNLGMSKTIFYSQNLKPTFEKFIFKLYYFVL